MFNKEKFIQCIQDHPPIWKKSCKGYSDRKSREKSWHVIGEVMFDEWDEMSEEEKQDQVKEMKTKWRHMRDSFSKYINQERNGDPTLKKKKYVYADSLSFLLQTLSKRTTSRNVSREIKEEYKSQSPHEKNESSETDEDVVETVRTSTKASVFRKPSARKSETFNDFEQKLLEKLGNRNTQEAREEISEDSDKSFLMSILGDLRKLNDEEKLDFRFHTLQFFRDIQRKRKIPQPTLQDQFSD
ncbi:uncharacterized protein LOC108913296 [Anoplophora glabripennis]|uniref:uncharacterized protein LOC108913296 n=1 Tax=Anoplophora glabripennis TaxID=217634 RepID=UPI0008754538|nr:uncharacterized protein LOC108913296 [Anoplophora glabripennis]